VALFLDVHPLGNFTKKELEDTLESIPDKYGVQVLQMLFNEKENILYCVCEAPDVNSIKNHHKTFDVSCDSIVEIDQIQSESLIQSSILKKIEQNLIRENKLLSKQIDEKNHELIKTERLATIGMMSSRIAHDLKNPLTIIQTYADILTPEILSKLDPKDREKWFRLQTSIHDMDRIIEDVLDFARTSALKKSKTSFLRLLKLSINHVHIPIGVVIHMPENDITFSCDARKMEGVISNLLSNAVYAINGHGEISIRIFSDSDFIEIQIEDSGPGISESNLDRIFEPLFTTKKTGTGLGLVICKSIVEQHGGTIFVANNPTTFTLKLPI